MYYIIVSLILVGILLMLVEILLTPGVGVAGILGVCALAASSWYSFTYAGAAAGIIVTVLVTLLLVATVVIVLRKKTWKRFALDESIDARTNAEVADVTAGQTGVTVTRLAPAGTARVGGLTCEVVSDDNSLVPSGTQITVVRIEENRIFVKKSE